MGKHLLKNIKQLVQAFENESPSIIKGIDMQNLKVINDAFLIFDNDTGLTVSFGEMKSFSSNYTKFDLETDLTGKIVLPCWVDSHTHIVFANSRENEFVDRIKGLSYEEIAANGGGILNSAKTLRNTPEDELLNGARKRLNEIIGLGTGAVEIKSGYGLSVESELKMLRVIKRLKNESPIPIKSTFLGAHAMPVEYKENREGYLNSIINEMLPNIKEEKLADYIDVFCDRGFYTPEETDRILEAGYKHGLEAKIHANELDYSGGIQVGVKHNARSVDHLEFTGDEEIETLLNSNTMPTLLPSTAFFLKLHYPPARKMLSAGLPLALASDYNPGSSPSGNMNFVISLACIYLDMMPEEAINAATINSAYAMNMEGLAGVIKRGMPANFIVSNDINSYKVIPYSFGKPSIEQVYINGKTIH